METNLEEILKTLNNLDEYLVYITEYLRKLDKRIEVLESTVPNVIY